MLKMNKQPPIPEAIRQLLAKGGAAWGRQEYRQAKQCANEALQLANQHNSVLGELGAFHLLANIAFNQCQDQLSSEIHEQVILKSRKIGFWGGEASSLINLALIAVVDGDFDSATDNYEQAMELYELAGNSVMVRYLHSILVKRNIATILEGIPRILL